jgi:hypothetical protein
MARKRPDSRNAGVIRVTSPLGAGIMARWVALWSGVGPAAYRELWFRLVLRGDGA